MNREFLINTVSKLLGVSSSEKEFAFQIFLDKTAASLGKNEALKYPGLGFFYFKESETEESEFVDSLLYVPIQNSSEMYEENFFLSFDVKKRNKSSLEFDPSVFSLSVDKSTLPFERDSSHNTDLSYHLLKKTIEERVEELISSALHIENFKILDTLFTEKNTIDDYSVKNDKDTFEIQEGSSYEEMIFSRMNFDELNDTIPVETRKEEPEAGFDIDNEIFEKTNNNKDINNLLSEKEIKDDSLPVAYELLEPEKTVSPDHEPLYMKNKKEDVNWAWNEELLDGSEEKENKADSIIADGSINADDDKHINLTALHDEDPFGELEKTLVEEIADTEIPAEEINVSPIADDPIIQQEPTIAKKEQEMADEQENIPTEENNPYPQDDSSQKRNILLICALILIAGVAVFIIFFNGFGLMKKNNSTQQKAKSDLAQGQAAVSKDSLQSNEKTVPVSPEADKSLPVKEKAGDLKSNAKTEDKTQKLKESKAGDLLREVKNDNKVGPNIFSDGGKFYVQVSSWKNLIKAEQEAKRLKAKGDDAFIVKAYIEQFKGTWYRVRVGSFKSREEAEAYSRKNR